MAATSCQVFFDEVGGPLAIDAHRLRVPRGLGTATTSYTIDDLEATARAVHVHRQPDTTIATPSRWATTRVGSMAAPANTISLEVLNDEFVFDFDVLDIPNVTKSKLIRR